MSKVSNTQASKNLNLPGIPPGTDVQSFIPQFRELYRSGGLSEDHVKILNMYLTSSGQQPLLASTKGAATSAVSSSTVSNTQTSSRANTSRAAPKRKSPAPISSTYQSNAAASSSNTAANQGYASRPTVNGSSNAGTSSPQTPRAVVPPAPIPPPAEAGFRIRSDPVVAQAMRNTIREILASLDPYAEMEPEFEDMMMEISDEFIESVTQFSSRLARHRGSDTLEVKDLQLHLERQHGIKIPGFAPDEPPHATNPPTAVAAAAAAADGAPANTEKGRTTKKDKEKTVSLRTTRLNAVKQAR